MDKQVLISLIEKYYLNSIIEKVKWNVKDNNITVDFISPNKDMIGKIQSPIVMNDCEIAIFDTSQLFKLVDITKQFITLEVNKINKVSTKLLIADSNYNLEYALADLMLIPKLPKVEEPNFDFSFFLDKEILDKFIKGKKAVDTETFYIQSKVSEDGEPIIEFVIGENNTHSNKVIFQIPAETMNLPSQKLFFNASYVKEIFDANKDVVKGSGKVSEQGLMKIEFEGKDNQKSNYILIAKD